MPSTLLALNWKMNKTPTEARSWAEELKEKYAPAEGVELAVMAPALALSTLAANLPAGVAFGGQDVSAHEAGAYTGEISAAMLKDVGAAYVVVGHSERREYHGETDAVVAAKAKQAQANGLVPIVCVGEKLEVRERGEHVSSTLAQLRGSLADVGEDVVVAYEPVPCGPSAPARPRRRTMRRKWAPPFVACSRSSTARRPLTFACCTAAA